MSSIQMIAIDLDDTLLRDDISVSDYTKQVLARALSRGVKIVIATGRMFQAARPWGRAIGLGDVPVICYTGSMTGLCESGKIIRDVRIERTGPFPSFPISKPMAGMPIPILTMSFMCLSGTGAPTSMRSSAP